MNTTVVRHSVVIGQRKTSISLEAPFWNALKEIASDCHVRLSNLVAEINANRQYGNLASAIRIFVLRFYRDQMLQLLSRRQVAA